MPTIRTVILVKAGLPNKDNTKCSTWQHGPTWTITPPATNSISHEDMTKTWTSILNPKIKKDPPNVNHSLPK